MTSQIAPYKQLKQLVSSEEIQARFKDIMGSRAPAFLASVLNTVYINDYLRDADPNSVIISALTAAALDLPVDPNLGMAWIIPYKEKGVKIARFQMGYKGYIQLAHRSGMYEAINAFEVYEGQVIKVDQITGKIIMNGERISDQVIGYGAYFKLTNGFEKFNYMTVEEVQAHAQKYSKSYSSKSSAWSTNFGQMAKKTVLAEILRKYGVLSLQMQDVIRQDSAAEIATMDDSGRDPFETPDDVIEGEMVDAFDPVAVLIEAKICENEHSARNLLPHAQDDFKSDADLLIAWGRLYRGWKDAGSDTATAADNANNGLDFNDA